MISTIRKILGKPCEKVSSVTHVDEYSKRINLLEHASILVECAIMRDDLIDISMESDVSRSQLSKLDSRRPYQVFVELFYELVYPYIMAHNYAMYRRFLTIIGLDSTFIRTRIRESGKYGGEGGEEGIKIQMKESGYEISYGKIDHMLHDMGYRLKGNKKTREGKSNPDRNEQFQHINNTAIRFMENDDPVISVDAKKKELIGNFKNNGKEWKPPGEVDEVNVYDFLTDAEGKAIPYGIYDIKANEGWVNVGIDHDTAEFAVESIRRWWNLLGKKRYPNAEKLMITADGGGSNGSRVRLWKIELQKFADESNLDITVCHFPPGMSKWNKIEHRMFSYITINWRGKPLRSYETIIELIGNTRTKNGLKISADIDTCIYETGKIVTDEELEKINMIGDEFHGNWNYTIGSRRE